MHFIIPLVEEIGYKEYCALSARELYSDMLVLYKRERCYYCTLRKSFLTKY